jgi:hypothetical protein
MNLVQLFFLRDKMRLGPKLFVKNVWASLQSQAALVLACIDVQAQNWYSNVLVLVLLLGDEMFRK